MKLTRRLIAFLTLSLFALSSFAQTYPVQTPTYIPTAQLASTTFTAPGNYVFVANNIGTATVRIAGTCTGLTAAPQGSNDNVNWTTIQMFPVANGPAVTSVTAPGFWRINASGLTRIRINITALTASCTVQMAGTLAPGATYDQGSAISLADSTATNIVAVKPASTAPAATDPALVVALSPNSATTVTPGTGSAGLAGTVIEGAVTTAAPTYTTGQVNNLSLTTGGALRADLTTVAGVAPVVKPASTVPLATDPALVVTQSVNGDPCEIATVAKSSVAVNVASATTAALVGAVASKSIYVCAFTATAGGTSPTVQFKYGTQVTTACDTGPVVMTGTFAPTSGNQILLGSNGTIMQTIASQQLCVTTGGTSPSLQGVLTYVQQ